MSNKVVVISNNSVENISGLQCFAREPSSISEQLEPIPPVSFLAVSDEQRLVQSPHRQSVLSGSAITEQDSRTNISNSANSGTNLVHSVRGGQHDEDSVDNSENISNDQDDESGASKSHRLVKPPSIHLRYTGTRIPGCGFDGGVGKCILYGDGVHQELTAQEVVDILTSPDLSKLSTMPPVRPRGGTMYLYRCPDFETRHDLRADGYLWCQQGTKRIPKEDPVVKRFYMYIRTEEPIRNVSKRPKKTFAKYDTRFKKCEFELINAEEPLVLVHYIGDESVWKPFSHMLETQNDQSYPPSNTAMVLLNTGSAQSKLAPSSREEERVREYLNYGRRDNERSITPAAKRPRPSSRPNYVPAPANNVSLADTDFAAAYSVDASSSRVTPLDSAGYCHRTDTAVVDEPIGQSHTRMKYQRIFPTYGLCRNGRMEGFVHSLSIVPQVAVTGASKSLLSVANDLAQLSGMQKIDRLEFYYVSAGPIASGYYLSTLLFRHCLFDVEPIVPVAFMVHERRSVADHRHLFELVKAKCPDIADTECVFITDREFGSISSLLSKAVQLYSWHYIEDDVTNWIESNNGTTEQANAYVNDVVSLMKLKDAEQFIRELALKRRQWTPAFASYFDSYLKVDIIEKGGRWCSGGLKQGIYDPFCGIVIPSCNYLNDLVGDLVSWPEASLEQVLQCLYYFSEYYVREIERSMHQVGLYNLLPRFAHYSRPPRRLRKFPELEVTNPRAIVDHVRISSYSASGR